MGHRRGAFRDAEGADAGEPFFQPDDDLAPGDVRSQAAVRALGDGDVAAVCAGRVDPVGLGELLGVAVRGCSNFVRPSRLCSRQTG